MRKFLPSSYRWIFLVSALLFAQISLAIHDHADEPITASHECVVCQAHSTLDHADTTSHAIIEPATVNSSQATLRQQPLVSQDTYSPPTRGPPSALRI